MERRKKITFPDQAVCLEDFEDSVTIVENNLINVAVASVAKNSNISSTDDSSSTAVISSSKYNSADNSDDESSNINKNMSVDNVNMTIDEGGIEPRVEVGAWYITELGTIQGKLNLLSADGWN